MIHEAFSKSEIAKRYYALKTGEKLANKEAFNRWRMLRNPDMDVLKKVIEEVVKEQKKLMKS